MLVYRLCKKDEIDSILKDKSFEETGTLGKTYIKNQGEIDLNTHHYEEDERYMHFFPKIDYLFFVTPEKEMYICYYDIPDEVLDENIGIGEYLDYFTLSVPRKIPEYSINTKELNFEYLERIDLITDNITPEDYFEDENLSNYTNTIYRKNKPKTL